MKSKRTKVTRKITALLAMTMLTEQIALVAPVIKVHAEDLASEEYSIAHNVTSSWNGGCTAEIVLTNQAGVDTENWSVSFCTRDEITNLWGGKITDCEEFLVSDAFMKIEQGEVDLEEVPEEAEEETESSKEVSEKNVEENTEEAEHVEETYEDASDPNEVMVEKELADVLEEKYEDIARLTLLEADTEEVIEDTEEAETKQYYCYTIEALDYNSEIPAGGSVTIGYSAVGDDHGIWGDKASIIFKQIDVEENTVPVGGNYVGDGYTVDVFIPDSWEKTYNVQLKITNTSEETLHNWAFVIKTNDSISGLYNAVELADNDGVHLIKNAGYNQDIPAGGTIEIGYTSSYEKKADVPTEFALSQIEKEVTSAECEVSLFITDEWEDGGLAEIVLTNISEKPIEDWMLEFNSALEIEEMWGGVIENHENEHYFLRNSGYEQNIMPGESWTIGLLFSSNVADIRNVDVKQIVVEGIKSTEGILTVSKEHMTLNEDDNYVLNADFSMFTGELVRVDEVTKFIMQVYDKNDILIYETDITPLAEWTNDNYAFIYGIDRVVFEVSFGDECYSEELIIDCDRHHNFDKLDLDLDDNDSDGLPNYLEVYFGSDQNNVDTDDDGLTDYQELYTLGYNPCNPDTDADGILDCDEDEDEDGIGNKAEYDMGSNPISIDSDHDKLLDSIEITFGTSLILADTDNDGISDYDEYTLDQMGAVYNSADNTYTAVFSVDTMDNIYDNGLIPSVTLTGDALAVTSFSMSTILNDVYLNSTMVGYLGCSYEFTTDGYMVGAELTFTYDESYIDADVNNPDEFYPAIYWFDPDTHSLIELENQTWRGNSITAHLEHFSSYAALNKIEVEKFKNRTLESIYSGSGIDIGIDDSWSDIPVAYDSDCEQVTIHVKDETGIPVTNAEIEIRDDGGYHFKLFGDIRVGQAIGSHSYGTAKTDFSGNATFYLKPGAYSYLVCDNHENDNCKIASGFFYVYNNSLPGYSNPNDVVLHEFKDESRLIRYQLLDWDSKNNREINTYPDSYRVELYEGWDENLTKLVRAEEMSESAIGWPGWISFENLHTGLYTIKATSPGYEDVITYVIADEQNWVSKIHMEKASFDKGLLRLHVKDEDGNPVSNADVRICKADAFGRYGNGVMNFDCTNIHEFMLKGRTNANGEYDKYLEPGAYTILVDKDNTYGTMATVGEYYSESYHNSLRAGDIKNLHLVLTSYSYDESKVEFVVHNKAPEYKVLYQYKLQLYAGWGLAKFVNPVIDIESTPAPAFFNEVYAVTVPMGRYTLVVEKDGYSKRVMEILVSENNFRAYNVVLGDAIETVAQNSTDKNGDGLDDDLTKLVCLGRITTATGSMVWAGCKDDPTWEVVYEKIMEDDDGDYDDDGLKNGEEIHIYYEDGIPFLGIESNPELINSDIDEYSDFDELKQYHTDPLKTNFTIYTDDYSYLNDHTNFDSAISYDKYLDRCGLEIGVEYATNTIILGGEAYIIKAVTLELSDLFVQYADENYRYFVKESGVNTANNLIRLLSEAAKMAPAAERITIHAQIKLLQLQRDKLINISKTINTTLSDFSEAKNGLDSQISKASNYLANSKLESRTNLFNKAGGYFCIGLTVAAAIGQTKNELELYHSGLTTLKYYESTLEKVIQYDNGNIAEAAQLMYQSIKDTLAQNETELLYAGSTCANMGFSAGVSYYIANRKGKITSKLGLGVDLIWVGLIIGDNKALNNKITNAIRVQCADAFRMPIHHIISNGTHKVDSNGNNSVILYIGNDNIDDYYNYKELMRIYSFARGWEEAKYLYILTKQDSNWRLNGDEYLYQNEKSEEKASANIELSKNMMLSY